jgi:hypothetical protein
MSRGASASVPRRRLHRGVRRPAPADCSGQFDRQTNRTVINQRHASEIKDFDEREVVISIGMAYDNPAWNGAEELTEAVIDRTRGLLRMVVPP